MTMTKPTVIITGQNGQPVRINADEHDPAKHGPIFTVGDTVTGDGSGAALPPAGDGKPGDAIVVTNDSDKPATISPPAGETINLDNGPATFVPPVQQPGPQTAPPAPAAPLPPATVAAAAPLPLATPAAGKQAMQIGEKWFVCDPLGNKLMAKGFGTREEAEAVINAG